MRSYYFFFFLEAIDSTGRLLVIDRPLPPVNLDRAIEMIGKLSVVHDQMT